MADQPESTLRRTVALLSYPAVFVAITIVVLAFRQPLFALVSDPTALRDWVEGFGIAAPAAFVLLQVIQVVIFVIPGEVPQLAAGFVFGIPIGIALTLIGAAAGSAIGFLLARALGRPFLRAIVSDQRVSQVEDLIASPRGVASMFLLFLIPGIPKDFLCYVAGIGPLHLGTFLAVSTAGRLPGVAASVVVGNAAAERQWLLAAVVFGIAVALFALGLLFRKRLVDVMQRYARR